MPETGEPLAGLHKRRFCHDLLPPHHRSRIIVIKMAHARRAEAPPRYHQSVATSPVSMGRVSSVPTSWNLSLWPTFAPGLTAQVPERGKATENLRLPRSAALLDRHIGGADHVAPALRVRLDDFRHPLRSAAHRLQVHRAQMALHLRRLQHFVNGGIKLCDDRRRRLWRRRNGVPGI